MAPMLLRGLKGVNISCASPSSTAICSTIDHQPPVHRHHGRRSLDRSKLPSSTLSSPFSPSSKPSRSPKQKNPAYLLPASPASSSRYLLNGDFDDSSSSSSSSPVFGDPVDPVRALVSIDPWRFRSVSGEETLVDLKPSIQSRPKDHVYFRSVSASSSSLADASNNSATWVRFHTVDRGDDSAVLKRLPSARVDSHEQIGFPTGPSPSSSSSSQQGLAAARLRVAAKSDETSVLKSSTSARTRDQVVVLRVSLHCKGCEGKVRKHISRMPGVTSFSIDFATKKVTVIGDVTPLGVLSSISKVKNAQLWPPSSPSSPPPAPSGLSSTS